MKSFLLFLSACAVFAAGGLSPGAVLALQPVSCIDAPGSARNSCTTLPARRLPVKDTENSVQQLTATDHILGKRDAKILVIEYADFECPFCKRHISALRQMQTTYGSSLAIVFRHFPLSFHAHAEREAAAAECAAITGGEMAFWKYHDLLFRRTKSGGRGLSLDQLAPLARSIGLNERAFAACIAQEKGMQRVRDHMQDGRNAGVIGTPTTFVINTVTKEARMFSGALPFSAFRQGIDEMMR